ncbi:MAG: pyruvate kinase alpha/beta domain-containing protein [Thermoproteota archaeon]
MGKRSTGVKYFAEPGPENTGKVIKAVAERIGKGDLTKVVVASTSGRTGVRFAKSLRGRAQVVAVSHEKMDLKLKGKIISLGGIAEDGTHLPLHGRGMDKVRDAFYTLGQGFKVALEVILIAADKGLVKPYEDVIGVGGSGEGADTAVVARATPTREIFSSDKSKRLEVREIICMPLKKKWWD